MGVLSRSIVPAPTRCLAISTPGLDRILQLVLSGTAGDRRPPRHLRICWFADSADPYLPQPPIGHKRIVRHQATEQNAIDVIAISLAA